MEIYELIEVLILSFNWDYSCVNFSEEIMIVMTKLMLLPLEKQGISND